MGPYDKPLFDPQPGSIIIGIVLIFLGLMLSDPVLRPIGITRYKCIDYVLSWLCILFLIFGAAAIVRGIGFRSLFQP